MTVSRRGLGALLGLAVAGGVGGWTWSASRPAPGPAEEGPLARGTLLHLKTFGPATNRWTVPVPRAWGREDAPSDTVRFATPGREQRLRLLFLPARATVEELVSSKLREREVESTEVRLEERGADWVRVRFVDQEQQERISYYRWYDRDGLAALELLINGRPEDAAGLEDLFTRIGDNVTPAL